MAQWKINRKYNRIVKRFALLPICIDGTAVWLETVYIVQHNDLRWLLGWNDVRFASKDEYDKYRATGDMRILSPEQKDILNMLMT